MLSLARSCSSASTSARRRAPEHRACGETVERIVDDRRDEPERLPRRRRARGGRRLRRRYDRPLRARVRGVARQLWRASRTRRCATRSPRPTWSRSSRAHGAAALLGSRFMGRCPFHEERTPSFSVNPVDKLYYCFGCGKGGDVVSFVRETENLDFVGAIEWLAERFRVPLEYEESSPRAGAGAPTSRAALRRARPGGDVLRAAPVGLRRRRAGARVPRERGISEETARSSGSASRPGAGSPQKARSAASRSTSCGRPGSSTRAATTTSRSASMFPLATRAAASSASRRASS